MRFAAIFFPKIRGLRGLWAFLHFFTIFYHHHFRFFSYPIFYHLSFSIITISEAYTTFLRPFPAYPWNKKTFWGWGCQGYAPGVCWGTLRRHYVVPKSYPRHPVIFSADDWGVQSPPQHSIWVPLPFSEGDWIPRVLLHTFRSNIIEISWKLAGALVLIYHPFFPFPLLNYLLFPRRQHLE